MKQNKYKRFIMIAGVLLSSLTLIAFFVIGCIGSARPVESASENRFLTEFPKFSWESFFSGEYTNQISIWYSDTFPTRDGMIEANDFVQSLYGIGSGESASGIGSADELDKGETMDSIQKGDIPLAPDDGDGGDKIDGFYVVDDTAYELYGINKANSNLYVSLVAKAQTELQGKATVYDMIVPLSYEFKLGSNVVSSLNASDCSDSIDFMYSGFNGTDVKTVDICTNMMKHRNEYMYFRTDHHWTALGAYYAYEAFCQVKGISATPLSSYQRLQFDGFVGTLYSHTQNSNLKNNPDYVEAFVPIGTNDIKVTDRSNKVHNYSIVNKATDSWYQNANSKYNCFIAGDNPLSEIQNPSIHDGSAIVVVKESFGNAFIPFLVDSYEYVYVIDYRYFNNCFDQTLSEFVLEKGAKDVLFINNVIATSTSARINELNRLICG